MKLIDAVVRSDLIKAAKTGSNQGHVKRRGTSTAFKLPAGPGLFKAGMMVFPPRTPVYRRETYEIIGRGAHHAVVYEGLQLPIDRRAGRVALVWPKSCVRRSGGDIRSLFVSLQS